MRVWDVSEATARQSDPETSHLAAASVQNRTDTQEWILATLAQFSGMTDTALIRCYGYIGGAFNASPSGIRSRRSELVRRGLVRDSGKRATLPSGRQSIVWELVPEEER